MTETMYDSITVADLPSGAPLYAGYADGIYENAVAVASRFPDAKVLTIDVTGSGAAQCLDVENGDATVGDIDPWLANHAISNVVFTSPVIYMSVSSAASAFPNAHPAGCLLWTAHYSYANHICGPSSCGLLSYDADMTQWTDNPPDNLYDTSAVNPAHLVGPAPGPLVTGTQDEWHWCTKCGILVWDDPSAQVIPSVCPAGGSHAPGSWDYSLDYEHH